MARAPAAAEHVEQHAGRDQHQRDWRREQTVDAKGEQRLELAVQRLMRLGEGLQVRGRRKWGWLEKECHWRLSRVRQCARWEDLRLVAQTGRNGAGRLRTEDTLGRTGAATGPAGSAISRALARWPLARDSHHRR